MYYWQFFKENKRAKEMLIEWWHLEFSQSEREYIAEVNNWLPGIIEYMVKNEISATLSKSYKIDKEPSVLNIFSVVSTWFDNKKDRYISIKLLNKAEDFLQYDMPLEDIHFVYSQIIKVN